MKSQTGGLECEQNRTGDEGEQRQTGGLNRARQVIWRWTESDEGEHHYRLVALQQITMQN